MTSMDPVSRGPAAVFAWIWPSFEVLEWYALEEGSGPLRDATERLLASLTRLEDAFCAPTPGRRARRGPELVWTLQHATLLDALLQTEAGDPSHPLEALRRLRAALGALEDLLEIEARRAPAAGDE